MMDISAIQPQPDRSALSDDGLWYKDAIIYQIHIKSFFDSNNDGIGDFAGLISKLDYIADLGVNTIWLQPFYPSPRKDDGYDIADYRGVPRTRHEGDHRAGGESHLRPASLVPTRA
jgi:maltose alpha-D-glucosyltransferase/alpha-amylase